MFLKQTLILTLILIILVVSTNTQSKVLSQISANIQEITSIGTQKCCAHSVTLDKSHARSGSYSYKLTVIGSDPGLYPHHRAEIFPKNNMALAESEYWYGWSIKIPVNWVYDPNWVLITQWHTKSSTIMQPLQLQLKNNRWCWVNWIGKKPNAKYKVLWCESFENKKGKWIDWVVNVRWTSKKNGFFRIWRNGKKVVDVIQPTIFQDYSPYWKVGLVYPKRDLATHSIFVDELRIGDSNAGYLGVSPQ